MMLSPAASSMIVAGTSVMLLVALAAAIIVLARRGSRLSRHARRAASHHSAIARLRRTDRVNELGAAERYWTQMRDSAAPVLVTSPDGKVLAASAPVMAMFGYRDEEEFKQVSMQALYVNPEDRKRQLSFILREHGEVRSGEFRMKHRDGREINVLTTVRVIVSANGESCYEGVLTDITELRAAVEERRRLEGQLHLARKLELVGRLASGIAHEINTPMQFIGDNLSFLKRAFERLTAQLLPHTGTTAPASRLPLNSPEKMKEFLADIAEAFAGSLEGVERVSETVRAMKEFAHPGDLEMTSTDLNQALRTALVVGRSEYKHAAEVELQLGDIPPVDCRRAELNKVFLNLIVNAAHAIEAKGAARGTITIRTRTDGALVRIEIADTGCGIAAAVLPRIFDPFFTTKAVGKGSGQGLAIARTIVTGHGGDLDVASTVGQGTTFTITLPVAPHSGPAAVEAAVPIDLEAPIG